MSPPVTVVVPTNRAAPAVAATLSSILACDYPEFEIVVVAQGPAWPPIADPRVRIHYIPQPGLSLARNAGFAAARFDVVACTDDDCLVDRNWLTELVGALLAGPGVGLAFGSVWPGPHDARSEFVLSYTPATSRLARHLGEKHRIEGLAGCMGMRREVWCQLHGFDPRLGAGAAFEGGEEVDLSLRALLAGWQVALAISARVEHRGARPRAELGAQLGRYMRGTGAAYAKLLRLHGPAALVPLLRLAVQFAGGRSGVQLHGPQRWHKLVGFAQGFWHGLVREPLDPQTGLFGR